MVLRDPKDPLNQSRGIMGPLGDSAVQNNRGRLRQRFDLIRKLGQGTYGKVQLGIDKETGQEVAIKTIKKSKIETEADLIRIRREIQIMSSVRHPNIIHIYEVFENREKMVLVMEYASGGELYDYLSERKILQDGEARRIFRQVASAVYYCHKHKICHRDLKLENILLDEKANAKIADFGLSNVFDDVHLLKTFCGSPLYASPEIVRGTPYYGPEVDCWSLGVLLYTLVYGAMPFDGSNFKRLVKQISTGEYYEPKKPVEASSLIKRMLTVDPIKRASIKDVCAHEWINDGFDKPCLASAEELATQTPVRLDLLLSVAPGHNINHSQVVIACNDGDRTESDLLTSDARPALEASPKDTKGHEKDAKPSTSKHKDTPSTSAAAAQKDAKRKTVVKKKSKSSPMLELIVDEEEEQGFATPIDAEGDDDGGDTLSEISEIQTLADDGGTEAPKQSKSKAQVQSEIKESSMKTDQVKAGVTKKAAEVEEPPKTEPAIVEKTEKVATSAAAQPKKQPEVKTSLKPEVTTALKPEVTTALKPEVTTALKPEVSTAPKPDVTTAPKPEVTTAPKPEVTTAPKPEVTTAPKPDVTTPSEVTTQIPIKSATPERVASAKTVEQQQAPSAESKAPEGATKPPVKKKLVKKVAVKDKAQQDSSGKSISSAKSSPSAESSSSVNSSADKLVKSKDEKAKPIKLRERSGSTSSDPSPTRIERRNSKIISQKTAELIQNLETKATNNGDAKPKKLVLPSVKVSDAKRAFETKPPRVQKDNGTAAVSTPKPLPLPTEDTIRQAPKKIKSPTEPSPDSASKIPTEVPSETTTTKTAAVTQVAVEKPAATKPSEPKVTVKKSENQEKKPVEKNSEIEQEKVRPVTLVAESSVPSPDPASNQATEGSQDKDAARKGAPKKKLTKLVMPNEAPPGVPSTDQLVKPVLVDSGSGTPKQAVMLVAGRTTPPVKSSGDLDSDPFFSVIDSITAPLKDSVATPTKATKEQAVKKISSVISRITSSESMEAMANQKKDKPSKKVVKTEVSFPVVAAPSKERVIPIRFEDDVVPSTPPVQAHHALHHASSKVQSAPNISRLPSKIDKSVTSTSTIMSRQNSSDTESSLAPPPRLEAIKKSPREFIIPIKLETSGQTVTPKEDVAESSHSEDPFRSDSRLRLGRFGRTRKYSSLLSDSSLEDVPVAVSQSASTSRRQSNTGMTPCHARSHSQGDEPDSQAAPITVIKRYSRSKRGSGGTIDRSDSFSSAEEDDEDAFEVLTAESLFSSLLDRVRNLTTRLNRDDETACWSTGPESPALASWGGGNPFRDFMSRAPSEVRGISASGSYTTRRSYSREPSVTVTISTGPSWRRSLSRETSRDSDSTSVAYEPQTSSTSMTAPHSATSRNSGVFQHRLFSRNDQELLGNHNFPTRTGSLNLGRARRTPSVAPHHQSDTYSASESPAPSSYPYTSSLPTRAYGRTLSSPAESSVSRTLPTRPSLSRPEGYRYGSVHQDGSDSYSTSSRSTYDSDNLPDHYGGTLQGYSRYPLPPTSYTRSLSSTSRSSENPKLTSGAYSRGSGLRYTRESPSGEFNGWVGGLNSPLTSSVPTEDYSKKGRHRGGYDEDLQSHRFRGTDLSSTASHNQPETLSSSYLDGRSSDRNLLKSSRSETMSSYRGDDSMGGRTTAKDMQATREIPSKLSTPTYLESLRLNNSKKVTEVNAPCTDKSSRFDTSAPAGTAVAETSSAADASRENTSRMASSSSSAVAAAETMNSRSTDAGTSRQWCTSPDGSSDGQIVRGGPKRDSRGTSVEKITRLLERMSMPRDHPAPSFTDSVPSKTNGHKSSEVPVHKDPPTSSTNNVTVFPEKVRQEEPVETSNQLNSKGSKSRIIQSLEKKWGKITAPFSSASAEKAASNLITTNSKPDQGSAESLKNLDRESVLLQRAVSPEKKAKSKFGASTVGLMLGKFKKFEELNSKIPTSSTTTNFPRSTRRVTSAYAGTASDSVLTLLETGPERARSPPTLQNKPTNGNVDYSTVGAQQNRHHYAMEVGEHRNESSARALQQSSSLTSGVLKGPNTMIPRLSAQNVYTATTMDASLDRGDLMPRIKISRSRDSTPTSRGPASNGTDNDDDNALTATSDSLETSSVCSEKTEISGRSVLDDEESVSDRIFRKSFYPRFNSLDRKKPSGRHYAGPKNMRAPSRSSTSPVGASPLKDNEGTAGRSKSKRKGEDAQDPSSRTIVKSPGVLTDNINKYNPNPLFKELIPNDFQTDTGNKADYSRRVTNKLSELLREIESDISNTTTAQSKHPSDGVIQSPQDGRGSHMVDTS